MGANPGGTGRTCPPTFWGGGQSCFLSPHFMYKITTIFHIACSIHHITSLMCIIGLFCRGANQAYNAYP